jgi:hypothetical protein
VVKSGIQSKTQVLALGANYFRNLFSMLQTHGGGLRAWFENWVIDPSFDSDGHAPRTKYLQELLNDTAPDAVIAVREAIADNCHPLVSKDLVSSTTLMLMLANHVAPRNMPSVQYLGALLREEGYMSKGRYDISGTRHCLWVRRGGKLATQDAVAVARKRMSHWEEISPDDLEML